MKILVLGGSGFLGGHLIDELILQGHSIISLDVAKERYRKIPEAVKFFEADFGNRGVLIDIFNKEKIDIVVHLVSTTLPSNSNLDPLFDITTNLIESVALLDLCVKYKVTKFVYFSSGGTVYGDSMEGMINENHQTNPICSYGIVKLAFEKYIQMYQKQYGLGYSILRLSNPYGPRQDPTKNLGAVAVFLDKILNNEKITIWGDGSVVRDFIYVKDVIDIVIRTINSSDSYLLNVGSGKGVTLNELIQTIESILGKKAKVEFIDKRSIDVKKLILDCEFAKNTFGWEAETSLENGIQNMLYELNGNN
jgi:UDP-glucose 4-epimerase